MGKELKLNTGQTVRVGFAFLAILTFWQMYNNVIPLILTKTFHMDKSFSGLIMAADNVLALFLLPLFGGLSDRCSTRIGRRKPFILGGKVRNNLESYCDRAYDEDETILVTRKEARDVVILSLERYNALEKDLRNVRYLAKIERAFEQLYAGKGQVYELIVD